MGQINPPATYFFHSLHGLLFGFDVLMSFLKAAKDSFSFISDGTVSHIFGSIKDTVSFPL